MNREYLGPIARRGTFLCRSIKVGDFVIGKDAIEELDAYIWESKMPTAPRRNFDPFGIVTNVLRKMRGYNLPPTKHLWEEDVIMDYFEEDKYQDMM